MSFAYRAFRYGEQVEVGAQKPARGKGKGHASGLSFQSITESLEFLE
jgi:hypothetical protein